MVYRSTGDPFDLSDVFEYSGSPDEMVEYLAKWAPAVWRNLSKDEIRRRVSSSIFHEAVQQTLPQWHSSYMEKVGVCCFSFRPDSQLMWSHYSGGHTGVSIVIEVMPPVLYKHALIEVQYERVLPKWNLVVQRLKYGETILYNRKFDQIVLGTKYKEWEYEAEYRLISRKKGKNEIDPTHIIGLILGAKMSLERKSEIIAAVDSLQSNMKIVAASLDHEKGAISIPYFGFANTKIAVGLTGWRLLDDGDEKWRDLRGTGVSPAILQF